MVQPLAGALISGLQPSTICRAVSNSQFELLPYPLFCAAAKQKSFEEYEQDVWQELSQLVKDAKSLRTYLVRDRTAWRPLARLHPLALHLLDRAGSHTMPGN